MRKRQGKYVVACVLALFACAARAADWFVATNGNDSFDGTNWAAPKLTIQAAVDVAASNDTVWVSNGVYATGVRARKGNNRVALDKPIVVQSVNGPDATIILGSWHPLTTNGPMAVRCAYVGTNATLSGFTLTNGATVAVSGYGGGAYGELLGTLTNCTLTGNSASTYGGGVYQGILRNCTLSNNVAHSGGGAYRGVLDDCTLVGNVAGYGGGSHTSVLTRCTLIGNFASHGGGAHWGDLRQCTLIGNAAASYGGGACQARLERCLLFGNTSEQLGGGVWDGMTSSSALIGNSARRAGGGSSHGALNHCTLIGNSAGLENGGSNQDALDHCIVYGNEAPIRPNYGESTFRYSCTTPMPEGTGNIADDPLLAGTARLLAGSPCIGAGSGPGTLETDIDGEAWSDPPSMGCDEVRAGAVTGALAVAIRVSYTNVAVGYPVRFQADVSGRITGSEWRWGDGTRASNEFQAVHVFPAGIYGVELIAYNEDFPAGVSATATVQVSEQMVHHVSVDPAASEWPYLSWGTAAANIQDAVDATAQAGALIWVSNGVYATGGRAVWGTITNRVALDKPVIVRSVNGPEATRIQGAWHPGISNGAGTLAMRCVYLGADAMLAGFMLTNGATRTNGYQYENGGGGAWCEMSGVLSNCVLTGNSAGEWGGGGGAYGGRLTHCQFMANSSESFGGGAYVGVLNDCALTGNSASMGGGVQFAVLNRCLLASNSAGFGGGACDAELNDCTLQGNVASSGGGATSCELRNCVLAGNSARDQGGGIRSCTLYSCLVTGNSAATNGGGSSYSKLNICTVSSNTAGSGGGSYFGSMTNCIVYHNTSSSGQNYQGTLFSASCTMPAPGGAGNVTNDPQFADAAAGNYRLRTNSPCINRGDNGFVQGETDLDGKPRIAHGTVDMGAYEAQFPVGYWAWAANITNGRTNYADCAAGDGMPNLVRYAAGSPDPMTSDDLARLDQAFSNGMPTLVFNRNPDAWDVVVVIQAADEMSDEAIWRGLATNRYGSWGGAANMSEIGQGNPVVCTIADTFSLQTNRFLRLKVTGP
ncbi:MAG: choice-of-anchor Q domain-containing protein [Kiritimatiellia bacterium]